MNKTGGRRKVFITESLFNEEVLTARHLLSTCFGGKTVINTDTGLRGRGWINY
jgi:hypothetical protein